MHRAQPKKRGNSIGGSSIKPAADGVDWNPSENVWTEEFLQQAAVTFESNMAALLSSLKGTSGKKLIYRYLKFLLINVLNENNL